MPYASKKQAAYIHAEAGRGTAWAKKFVKDSEGSHVQVQSDRMPKRAGKHLRTRRK